MAEAEAEVTEAVIYLEKAAEEAEEVVVKAEQR